MKLGAVWSFVLLLSIALSVEKTTDFVNDDPKFKLIVFEGSDWCKNCRRLEKNILKSEAFQEFLRSQHVTVEKIDFPQRKKLSKAEKQHNAQVAEKYGFDGTFPTLLLASNKGEEFVRLTNYTNQTTEEMIGLIEAQLTELE